MQQQRNVQTEVDSALYRNFTKGGGGDLGYRRAEVQCEAQKCRSQDIALALS